MSDQWPFGLVTCSQLYANSTYMVCISTVFLQVLSRFSANSCYSWGLYSFLAISKSGRTVHCLIEYLFITAVLDASCSLQQHVRQRQRRPEPYRRTRSCWSFHEGTVVSAKEPMFCLGESRDTTVGYLREIYGLMKPPKCWEKAAQKQRPKHGHLHCVALFAYKRMKGVAKTCVSRAVPDSGGGAYSALRALARFGRGEGGKGR